MTRFHRACLVCAGGACGGLARVVLAQCLPLLATDPALAAPALLVVNISGSLFAGCLVGLLRRTRSEATMLKVDAFMLVGFCGGFTSYSACVVSLETAVAKHEILTGALALSTFVLAPFAAALGMHLMVRYPDEPVPTQRSRMRTHS